MANKYVIATVQYPVNWPEFLACIRGALQPEDALLGYVVVPGPGCYNHGVMIGGPNHAEIAKMLAMVLQPGKYASVPDDDPAVEEGKFERCERLSKS